MEGMKLISEKKVREVQKKEKRDVEEKELVT